MMQFDFKKASEQGTRPQGAFYYNNIRFIDESFWKEVKFIRDVLTKSSDTYFKVVHIMKKIVTSQMRGSVS